MTSIPPSLKRHSIWHRSWLELKRNLNFYRIHVLFFTFTPLIAAGVFYASNGSTLVPFIDALFLCVSSITVTGLATIDLSSTTPWQQVILFFLMCMGSPVTVSWIIVYVRRYFFAKKFEHIIESHFSSRVTPTHSVDDDLGSKWKVRLAPWHRIKLKRSSKSDPSQTQFEDRPNCSTKGSRVKPDMIRRVEGAPQLVNPSGWLHSSPKDSEITQTVLKGSQFHVPQSAPLDDKGCDPILEGALPPSERGPAPDPTSAVTTDGSHTARPFRRPTSLDTEYRTHPHILLPTPSAGGSEHDRPLSALPGSTRDRERHLPRTQTIEFVQPGTEQVLGHGRTSHIFCVPHESPDGISPSAVRRKRGSTREFDELTSCDPSIMRGNTHEHVYSDGHGHWTMPTRTATMQSNRSSIRPRKLRSKEEDFGGFPLPHIILARLLRRFFPRVQQRLTRTVTIPFTTTVQSQRGGQTTVLGARQVPYISFDAIVGRNSAFRALTRENLEELGGVEYRALNMLLWIVGSYHIGVPLIAFVIIAPYISQSRWESVFHPPQQHRYISPVWYSLFQVISAYTNTGTSLVDQSMVPFQKAYPEVLTLPFAILAGNTAFPVFLRFVIWLISKWVNKQSRAHETLHFLLDHPRRCFIYLFPSHQTWFLLTILFLLNFTDWFFFLVLDIGNPAIDTVQLGTRFAIGLLQATAVRAAGFGTVALSALAPAVKVLYVVMMYVSVYPIAMSIRSTNVYEERSLGVFEDNEDNDEEAALHEGDRSRASIWGRYLAAHARKQLSFDMWWLAFALFLLCVVERKSLEDNSNAYWFNIFTIIFELTSAYGTVGLSLGTPNANYSFAGALRPLSKLILCAVMLRGRHRGLPVAIDRAVLLPAEFKKGDEGDFEVGTTGLRASALGDASHDINASLSNGYDQRYEAGNEKYMQGNGQVQQPGETKLTFDRETERTTEINHVQD